MNLSKPSDNTDIVKGFSALLKDHFHYDSLSEVCHAFGVLKLMYGHID